MNQDILKKTLVLGIGVLFLGLTIIPTINAGNTDVNPTYKLIIITPRQFKKQLEPLVCIIKCTGMAKIKQRKSNTL